MTETNAKTPEVIAGKYEVIEVIGRGGMGTVYKALQRNLDRVVAIKMLSEELASDTEFRARFQQEATLIARLHHPNIIQVYDIEPHNHTFCIIMEFLEGESLQAKLDRDVCVSENEIVALGVQVAKALHHAHGHGIIHRDIKPDNIHISPHGLVKVMDFGIARYSESKLKTQTGISMGTPKFMSPEQVTGKHIDGQSDLYSLGVCLYSCLAGRVPFDGDNAIAIATRHLYEQPTPPSQINTSVSSALEKVVMKALEKNKAVRWGTGEELAQALEGTQGIKRQVYIAEESAGETVSVGATQRMSNSPFHNEQTETLPPSELPGAKLQGNVPPEISDKSVIPNPTQDNRSPHDMPQLQFDYNRPEEPAEPAPKVPWGWLALALILLIAAGIALAVLQHNNDGDAAQNQPSDPAVVRGDADFKAIDQEVRALEAKGEFPAALALLTVFQSRNPEYRGAEIQQRLNALKEKVGDSLAERAKQYGGKRNFQLALAFVSEAQSISPSKKHTQTSLSLSLQMPRRQTQPPPAAEAVSRSAGLLAEAQTELTRANKSTVAPVIAKLEEAIAANPANHQAWIELGKAFTVAERGHEARAVWLGVMERANKNSPQFAEARNLSKQ